MNKYIWIKDCIIQVLFISIAVIFTVMIAHMSISGQYTDFYRQQMHERARTLARNTALLFEEIDIGPSIVPVLDILFPSDAVRYTLFTSDGDVFASNVPGGDTLQAATLLEPYTKISESTVRAYYPVLRNETVHYTIMVQTDDAVFMEYNQSMASNLMASLLRGVLMMIIGCVLFAAMTRAVRSSYVAQTMQFIVFLVVFLAMFSLSMHNGFSAHIESARINELRVSSVYASLLLSGTDISEFSADNLPIFGEHVESLIIIQTPDGFSVIGDETALLYTREFFTSAWDTQSSSVGIFGEYKYGVTVILDETLQHVAAMAVVRQPVALLASELQGATIDFMLAMSATVLAFIFLFIQLNKLLEAINNPYTHLSPALRYAAGISSLTFMVTICKAIPAYFFVLIIMNIYNPLDWLPNEFATVLPLIVVILMMVVGNDIAQKLIRLTPRGMIILGCVIGASGFIVMNVTGNLFLWLLLLAVAYLGVSMVTVGLQGFVAEAAHTKCDELKHIEEENLSSEYLGYTSGAVLGAIVFDQFGMFAAFALSAAILIILAVLIRVILPPGTRPEGNTSSGTSFLRFFFSKKILFITIFLLGPFFIGEFFIEQYAPLYAASINLSPGAAAWTSLLMTIAAAYIAPSFLHLLVTRLSKVVICIIANMISALGMITFALMPGIATLYIASAMIGISVGIGANALENSYSDIQDSKSYKRSSYVFQLLGAGFGQLGVVLFTVAHNVSPSGEHVLIIAAVVAIPTLLYLVLSWKNKLETE